MSLDDLLSHLDASFEVQRVESKVIITRWSWDYADFLNFQDRARKFIVENKKVKIFLICNHPHVYTLGRGNERGREDLIDFKEDSRLDFDLFKIHRGGGLSFHYPGQWIIYPIVSLNKSFTLDDHMCWLLKSVRDNLKALGLENVITAKSLMGVWLNKKKLASIGVGVKRFVTLHGLALNIYKDKKMFDSLKKLNPCGLDPLVYESVDMHLKNSNLFLDFHHKFLNEYILK